MPHDHNHTHTHQTGHKHGHGGGHGHHHHHIDPEAGDLRVGLAVAVNVLLTVAQIIGGVLSGSVALIADAIHNLSDAASLAIAFFARKIARRPTDAQMTFGYKRVELVAALINLTTLVVIGIYLAYEGIMRFFEPPEVAGWLVIIVAGVALVVDVITALLTWSMAKDSANIRAAFLHNVADALGSVAVIVVGVLIVAFDWYLADPIATLGIAAYIIWMGLGELRGVARILMLGAPPGLDVEDVIRAMEMEEGVEEVHHVHLWQISEEVTSLEAHVVVTPINWSDANAVKTALKTTLNNRFGIGHVTLDMEAPGDVCVAPRRIGGTRQSVSG
ncbi:cation diffusion facilitator family transporter [Aliiroseovarius crassostreae]|uniref:cation diffusion facilitator family transporter n=1 Tax=Aliiroseovarius crassostreae TaxID=154981 RepID=UPI002203913E|nr:cation diffusion facilitator family transporter [Aliiroseovarius crassostreae]UWP99133.1 cation diffusion facilitator family transporter [Aliiroseovarius crassostreae]UWQ02329.1 cation diffusion facilitator family transporter [Aliiroseovarius crassostreae]